MANIKIGLVGLGRMGHAIAYRLTKNFQVYAFDPKINQTNLKNVTLVKNLKELAAQTEILWLMVPAGQAVDEIIKELLPNLKKNSILIDGGNSNFQDSVRRYNELKKKNINFVDCGTSGGLHGEELGFSLMIGSDKEIFEELEPVFKAIAAPDGYAHMGPAGSGHFVKMIHNGIEYSLLQAYAEGFNFLKNNSEYKNLDLEKISTVWNHGSIIRSWILQLAQNVFSKDQNFKNISGKIGENLTGRWTLEQAQKNKVTMPMLQKSLEIREWSRETGGDYSTKIVAMLRHEFGGHEITKL
jgi:6-phosphogluconate dehydrogenase